MPPQTTQNGGNGVPQRYHAAMQHAQQAQQRHASQASPVRLNYPSIFLSIQLSVCPSIYLYICRAARQRTVATAPATARAAARATAARRCVLIFKISCLKFSMSNMQAKRTSLPASNGQRVARTGATNQNLDFDSFSDAAYICSIL